MRTDKATKKAVQEQMKMWGKLPRKNKKKLKKGLTKVMIDLLPMADKMIIIYPFLGYAKAGIGDIMGTNPIIFK